MRIVRVSDAISRSPVESRIQNNNVRSVAYVKNIDSSNEQSSNMPAGRTNPGGSMSREICDGKATSDGGYVLFMESPPAKNIQS